MPYRILLIGICLLECTAALLAQNKLKGKASYYSDRLHGRYTSSGIKYHRDSFTCAHRSYPFGTLLKVTNPKNEKEVIVKVTDRGPFSKRLIIDLSRAAARQLAIIKAGIAPVEIAVYQKAPIPPLRLNEAASAPHLNLEILPCASFPLPQWEQDSALVARIKKPQHAAALRKNKPKEKEKHNKPIK